MASLGKRPSPVPHLPNSTITDDLLLPPTCNECFLNSVTCLPVVRVQYLGEGSMVKYSNLPRLPALASREISEHKEHVPFFLFLEM